jgi:PBP1b-binding outer membrane lipoprotein LpoB
VNRAAAFLFMLLLAGCSDAKRPPPQAVNEMIESPLQNTVISSFDTYPPKPIANPDGDLVSSLPDP